MYHYVLSQSGCYIKLLEGSIAIPTHISCVKLAAKDVYDFASYNFVSFEWSVEVFECFCDHINVGILVLVLCFCLFVVGLENLRYFRIAIAFTSHSHLNEKFNVST